MGRLSKNLNKSNQKIDKIFYLNLLKRNMAIRILILLVIVLIFIGFALFTNFYLYRHNFLNKKNYERTVGTIWGFDGLFFLITLFFLNVYFKIINIIKIIKENKVQSEYLREKTYLKIFKISKLIFSKKSFKRITHDDPKFRHEHDSIRYRDSKDMELTKGERNVERAVISNFLLPEWFVILVITIIFGLPYLIVKFNNSTGIFRIKDNQIVSENYKKLLLEFWPFEQKELTT